MQHPADHGNAPPPDQGGGGVRISRHGRGRRREFAYLALAFALIGTGIGYVALRTDTMPGAAADRDAERTAQTAASGAASDAGTQTALPTAVRASAGAGARGPTQTEPPPGADDLARYVPEGEAPTMNEVIERLHQAGIHTGLGAFNPPGTSPPLIGLAVPEDFPLPDGYVRHYQATDDGQRIEPILMFSPDYQFFDAQGRPIAIPENRVVPPELAPPGLALRPIAIPPPATPGRPTI